VETPACSLDFTIGGKRIFRWVLRCPQRSCFADLALSEVERRLEGESDQTLEEGLLRAVTVDRQWPLLQSRKGFLLYIVSRYPRYLTRFEGSFEAFLASLSGRTRGTLRRKVRRFAAVSPGEQIDWRRYESADEITHFMQLAVPLARETYQARLFDGALPDSRNFEAEAMALAAAGKLRAYLLFLEGKPVAYLYTPRHGNAWHYAFLGYDEASASLSPGIVLQYLVHEYLFAEEKGGLFDFTEGEGGHKALFANECVPCCDLLVLRGSPCKQLLIRAHLFWNRTVEYLRFLAERAGVKARLRRWLRRQR
tara:strand:- start:30269 stop:31195 length:927 start_codon:yes stop_codon:yes gene_type:complete